MENQQNNEAKLVETENAYLNIKITAFGKERLEIVEAKTYKYLIEDKKKREFLDALSSLTISENVEVKYDNFSYKSNKIYAQDFQSNSLFLSYPPCIDERLTPKQQLKVFSLLHAGYDLSEAAIMSYGLKDIENTKIKYLTQNQQKMVYLASTIACPSIIWFIDVRLVENLSNDQKYYVNNAMSIRLKHGGAVVIY
jgi:ABC-type transport system involved in cytochrome c biogenesis ATPase subunit